MSKKPEMIIPQTPFKFIFFFLKPYLGRFSILPLIALLWALHTTLDPYLLKIMVDILEKNTLNTANLFAILQVPVLIYILVRIFMNIVDRIYDYVSLKVLPQFNKNIVTQLTKYIQKHSHSYFQNQFGGSIVSKISTAADMAEEILDDFVHHFVYPLLSLVIAAWAITKVSLVLGAILLIWSVIFVSVSYWLSLRVQTLAQEFSEKHTTYIGKLLDSVTNILAVRLFARRKHELNYLEAAAQEKVTKAQELGWQNLKLQAVMGLMANALVGVVIFYLILERQKGNITIGDFVLILTLSISIIDIIWNISRNYVRFIEAVGKCTQSLKTIAIPHGIQDAKDAQPLVIKEGTIKFQKVTFGFDKVDPLFKDFSIEIKGGKKVGVVGLSGCGKTTFVNLIVRLFDIDAGSILIDNQDIKTVTQKSLHQNISFIPQEPILFHRTVWDNILYGNLEATEEDVIKAAKNSHADQFISALPQGYQTFIGERGSKLSGGQRQRLAMTRAVLKNSKILILDEATSALDPATEHYIQQSLEVLMEGKTVLVVAHRLTTLRKMDRLLVFDKGKVVEEGSHESLLEKNGLYAQLWNASSDKSTLSDGKSTPIA